MRVAAAIRIHSKTMRSATENVFDVLNEYLTAYDVQGFRFKRGCSGPYREYPLTHGAPYKNGDPPGNDRVIYSTPTHNTTKFCGE